MIAKAVIFSLLTLPAFATLAAQGCPAGGTYGPGNGRPAAAAEPAYSTREYDEVLRLRQRGDILPLEDILARARRYHAGQVLEAELETLGERYVYEVQLVDEQGRVRELRFDAATGQLIRGQREK